MLLTISAFCNEDGRPKRYNVYSKTNSQHIALIDKPNKAFVIMDRIKNITYLPDYCRISLVDFKDVNLVVPTKESLKLEAGNAIEVICFYSSSILAKYEGKVKDAPAYLAIRIDKLVSSQDEHFLQKDSAGRTEFIIGSILSITAAHEKGMANPNSIVKVECNGKTFSTEYVVTKFDKFRKSLKKETVLRFSNWGGHHYLEDIHDESIFKKLLNGEFPKSQ